MNAADVRRINKLRGLVYQAASEGWPTTELDKALLKLYGKSRAPAKPK